MPAGSARLHRRLFLAVWGLCALYALRDLDRGWIPHDEGTLAHSAERVLLGELPHRDYDEVYTGGLSAMNAVAFHVFGVNLRTPRLVLFGFFLAWIPAVFYVATRFTGPPVAALTTLLAVSWSIPNYPAAMPSWYNLFFAVFGLAALLRHLETGRARWLFGAGIAGGCSVLIKTSGIFFVASGLLFLAYREQRISEAAAPDAAGRGGRAYSAFTSAALLAFVLLLTLLVGGRSGPSGVVRFILPLGSLALFVLGTEWLRPVGARAGRRFRNLAAIAAPFLAGVLLPLSALALLYVALGAGGDLYRGLFELPTRRLTAAAVAPPDARTLWVALPLLALLGLDAAPSRLIRPGGAVLVLVAGVALIATDRTPAVFESAWHVLNVLGPLATLAGIVLLVRSRRKGADPAEGQRAFAAVSVAAGVMLIQFPFAGAIYLFYALPAVALAVLPFLAGSRAAARPVMLALMVALLLFTVRWINTGALFAAAGFAYDPTRQTERLALPRGGNLRVSPQAKEDYEQLVVALRDLSLSEYTLATPDLPEVYFLSGLANPTRTLFDFFDEPAGRTARILDGLEAHDVNVIVLNRRLRFSGPPPEDLLAELRTRYPRAAVLGGFIVRWREDGA